MSLFVSRQSDKVYWITLFLHLPLHWISTSIKKVPFLGVQLVEDTLIREWSLSLKCTGVEANLQGYEIYKALFVGVQKLFWKMFRGKKTKESFWDFYHGLHVNSAY